MDFLDGIRGVAALYVVLHHLSIVSRIDMASGEGFKVGILNRLMNALHYGVFFYGHYAVVIFITLSGFCLMLPYSEPGRRDFPFDAGAFLMRRIRRIVPPYAAAVVCSSFVTGFIGWDGPLSAAAVVSHLLMVHNLTPYVGTLNAPLWSVALEFQIYLVFAFLLLPMWRRAGLRLVVPLAVGIGLTVSVALHVQAGWLLGAFAFGMVAARVAYRGPASNPRQMRRLSVATAVAGAAGGLLVAVQNRIALRDFVLSWNLRGYPWLTDLCVAATVALVFVLCTYAVRSDRRLWLVDLLQSRPIRFLGTISYSLYLFHSPLLGVLHHFRPRAVAQEVLVFYYWGVGLPTVLGLAWVSYWLVERHFVSSPRKSLALSAS